MEQGYFAEYSRPANKYQIDGEFGTDDVVCTMEAKDHKTTITYPDLHVILDKLLRRANVIRNTANNKLLIVVTSNMSNNPLEPDKVKTKLAGLDIYIYHVNHTDATVTQQHHYINSKALEAIAIVYVLKQVTQSS